MRVQTKTVQPALAIGNWVKDLRCPKCHGKMYLEKDSIIGDSMHCLYCGFEQTIFMPVKKQEWDALAKYLNGRYGSDLPSDDKASKIQKSLNLDDYADDEA
jgi:hypothetical protein